MNLRKNPLAAFVTSIGNSSDDGYVLLTALVFTAILFTVSVGLVTYTNQYALLEKHSVGDAQALQLSEAGIDKAVYQLNQDASYSGETLTLPGGTVVISVSPTGSGSLRILSTGYVPNSSNPIAQRIIQADTNLTTDVVSFHYAVQSGNGGFVLSHSSSINGNVYSAGPVIGAGGSSHCGTPSVDGFGNCILGDVVSSGGSGLVYGITSTSSVYAHTIGNAAIKTTIAKNAYYATSITNTYNPSGNPLPGENKFPNSTDLATATLPISDAKITEWESDAAAGGTLASSWCDSYNAGTNTCTITSAKTVGPKKIPFNLLLKGGTFTVTGPLWIVGNLTLQTSPTIKMSASLGSQNVAIIADDPNNRNTSGVVNIGQGTTFQGSGSSGSYVFIVSWNTTAETGAAANNVCSNGSIDAICMNQSSSALVAYASHGQITFAQSAAVKSATAYKIVLTQSANVTYDSGLPSTLFESGPGGSYAIVPGTYVIKQ